MDIVAIVGLIVAIVAMVMGIKTHRKMGKLPVTIYEYIRGQWVTPHLEKSIGDAVGMRDTLIAVHKTPGKKEGGRHIPPVPHAFYGIVKINGQPAPVGTEVEARGEGVRTGLQGNPIETGEVGKYGSTDPLGSKLIVQGNIADGATLTFYVNDVCAEERAVWHSGKVTQLNLTVRG